MDVFNVSVGRAPLIDRLFCLRQREALLMASPVTTNPKPVNDVSSVTSTANGAPVQKIVEIKNNNNHV